MRNLKISSTSFKEGERIPLKHTCDGENLSPQLTIEHVPKDTKCLVLVVEDPDAPLGVFSHYLVFNIPPHKTEFLEGETLSYPHAKNDFGKMSYMGPCPPPGNPHRYYFKVYAMDEEINLPEGCSKRELKKIMTGHVIDEATLIGIYGRK